MKERKRRGAQGYTHFSLPTLNLLQILKRSRKKIKVEELKKSFEVKVLSLFSVSSGNHRFRKKCANEFVSSQRR